MLVLACALAVTPPVSAQQRLDAVIDSGHMVRMQPVEGVTVRGPLIRPAGPTSTVLQFCRYPAPACTEASAPDKFGELPIASLTRLEVSDGNQLALGAVIGGTIGGVLGSLIGSIP